MGKNKKKSKLVLATAAFVSIWNLSRSIGEHEVKTALGTVTAISKENKGPHGDVRAAFRFDDVAIPKMALKALLDKIGRLAGEAPTTRKIQENDAYTRWIANHPEVATKLFGEAPEEPAAEPSTGIFTKKELKVKVTKKALKKAFKGCNGMFDKKDVKSILKGAGFGESGTAKISDILPAFGDTPAGDVKAVFEGLI